MDEAQYATEQIAEKITDLNRAAQNLGPEPMDRETAEDLMLRAGRIASSLRDYLSFLNLRESA